MNAAVVLYSSLQVTCETVIKRGPLRAFWVGKIKWVFIRKRVDWQPEAEQNVSTVQLAVEENAKTHGKTKISDMVKNHSDSWGDREGKMEPHSSIRSATNGHSVMFKDEKGTRFLSKFTVRKKSFKIRPLKRTKTKKS